VANGVRHGRGPRLEFFKGFGAAGAKTLSDAVETHGAPFVMIAFEPDFREVAELAVLGGGAAGKGAGEEGEGRSLGVVLIKPARRARVEQKVIVDEFHSKQWRSFWRQSQPAPFRNSGLRWRV